MKDKTVRWDPGYPASNPRLDIHQQRFLLAAKAFAQRHNHSRHEWQHDFPVSVKTTTTTTTQYLGGNYHKHVHLQSLRRSAEAGSSLWQRTESSAFSVTIHHWAAACGDKLKSLHFSLDVFVESSSASPRGNLLWFAFIPNVVSANTTYFKVAGHVPSQLFFFRGGAVQGGGGVRNSDTRILNLNCKITKRKKKSWEKGCNIFVLLRLLAVNFQR